MLARLRKPESAVPPCELLDTSPVLTFDSHADARVSPDFTDSSDLKGRWLAVDLDDTLLIGSFTNSKEWGPLGGAIPGIRSDLLATDWPATLRRLAKGSPQRMACRKRHPFLSNPAVEVAFRPGMIEGLLGFKRRGLGLVLVTASARQRVDYLVQRFPVLTHLFSGPLGRIVTADDLVPVLIEAEILISQQTVHLNPTLLAHKLRPRSLAAKTPWAVSRAADIPPYDLLIDDSEVTAHLFQQAGLQDQLLWVEGRHPRSGYGIHIIDTAIRRLLHPESDAAPLVPLPCPAEALQLPRGGRLPPKVEDPLYYPLLHYRDQF